MLEASVGEAAVRVSGQHGELLVGYQRAAGLAEWQVVRGEGGVLQFRADLVGRHDYWFEQRPMDLRLTLGPVEWVWRRVEPSLVEGGDTVLLTLRGRPEVADARGRAR
jgi:hypothetical protein